MDVIVGIYQAKPHLGMFNLHFGVQFITNVLVCESMQERHKKQMLSERPKFSPEQASIAQATTLHIRYLPITPTSSMLEAIAPNRLDTDGQWSAMVGNDSPSFLP